MGITDWFSKKQKFRPKNGFAGLAHAATELHIEKQKLKHTHGKLECYIFYSTYISVLTSCSYLQYADRVDQLLINGIYDYKNFLKIDEDDFPFGFPSYIENRGRLYMNCIKKILENLNINNGLTIHNFVLLFETTELKDLEELDSSDLFKIMSSFDTIMLNLVVINSNGYKYAAQIENMNVDAIQRFDLESSLKIENLIILPFGEPRCMQCGIITDRIDLKAVPTDTEFGKYQMPTCSICRAKYSNDNG